MRGYCHLKLKNLTDAISDLEVWAEQNPDDEEERIKLSKVLFDFKGDPSDELRI